MLNLNNNNIHKFYFVASASLFSVFFVIGILNPQVTGLAKVIVLGGMSAGIVLFALGLLTWWSNSRGSKRAQRKANELLDMIARSPVGSLLTNAPKGFVVRIAELIEDLDMPARRICEDLLDDLYKHKQTPACLLPRHYGGTNGCILDWYQYDLCIVAAKEDMAFAESIRSELMLEIKGCRIHLDAAEGKWAGEKVESIRRVFYAASGRCLALLSEHVLNHPVRKTEFLFAMSRDYHVSDKACKNYMMLIPLDEEGLDYIREEKNYLSQYAKNMEMVRDHRPIVKKLSSRLKRSMYIGLLADVVPPKPAQDVLPPKHFSIALSFPSERQAIVKAVVEELKQLIPAEKVFYHPNLEPDLAGEDLLIKLQSFYGDQAELVVVFLCAEYVRSRWCRLEWGVIRDLRNHQPPKLMPLRFDKAHIPQLPPSLAYVDCERRTPREIAELIVQRLTLNRSGNNLPSPPLDD